MPSTAERSTVNAPTEIAEALRAAIRIGLDGPALPAEDVLAELRARYAAASEDG